MNAFGNEREEHLMHQHPPYESLRISPKHGNQETHRMIRTAELA